MKKSWGNKPQFNPKAYVKPGLPEWEVIQIKTAFDAFDIDGNGSIDPRQLKLAMKTMGYDGRSQTLYQMACDMQADDSGSIYFQQFLQMMTTKATTSNSREMFRTIFNLYDDEKTGYISVKNLRKMTKDLGVTVAEEQLQQMIEKADVDRDGLVSEEEFYNVLTKRLF